MNGPFACLVSQSSATSCLPFGDAPGHSSVALPRTHSDLVKFASLDPTYDLVSDVLGQMYQACIKTSTNAGGTW